MNQMYTLTAKSALNVKPIGTARGALTACPSTFSDVKALHEGYTLTVAGMGGFFSSNQFDPSKDLLDLHGKVALVTGGNAGIGFWTVAHLSKRGAKVYLAARNESKATGAIARLKALDPKPTDGKVIWHFLDLDDPRETKKSAEAFMQREGRLDILVNNAGIMASPYAKSKDGIVTSMVINYISPFVLVDSLSPVLVKTAHEPNSDVRVVNVASMIHSIVKGCKFDSIESFNTFYGASYLAQTKQYAQTKLATILWTTELQRRFDDNQIPVTCISLNPGGVHTDTAVNRLRELPLGSLLVRLTALMSYLPEQGSYTTLFAAASPLVREQPEVYRGKYLMPFGKVAQPSVHARDKTLMDTLWRTTEKILSVIYGMPSTL